MAVSAARSWPGAAVVAYVHSPARWAWMPELRSGEAHGAAGRFALAALAAHEEQTVTVDGLDYHEALQAVGQPHHELACGVHQVHRDHVPLQRSRSGNRRVPRCRRPGSGRAPEL